MIKRVFSGYRPGKPGLERVLGSLESEIMELIWRKSSEVSVRDLFEQLSLQREIAYTTVMTIMGRLADKKLLFKRKEGNAYLFAAAISKEEFTAQMVDSIVNDLLSHYSEAALASFVNRAGQKDLETIGQLEELLKAQKERNNVRDRS